MEENILAKEKIPKLFMFYSIPAIVSMLIVGTQSIIDGIFVGNFVGELAMASVNIATTIYTNISSIINGYSNWFFELYGKVFRRK